MCNSRLMVVERVSALSTESLIAERKWILVLFGCSLAYLSLVQLLRFRRVRALERKYSPQGRASFQHMSTNDAQLILKNFVELEFPMFFTFSTVIALYKTYGIPSISSCLVSTDQLANLHTASKRTADTAVLLLESSLNKPDSERAAQAIARINYLHAPYQKSGRITNNDMLYTLSVLALEPKRWILNYEWRNLTTVELCACGTYYKSMGDAMKISYDQLPSAKTGWQDGLSFFQELEQWSLQYEEMHMVPSSDNKRLAVSQFDIVFINVPTFLHNNCRKAMSVLVGERLRKAMMYPEAPAYYHWGIEMVLQIRRLVMRHLMLPRPEFLRHQYITKAADKQTGRYHMYEYMSFPWYVKPSW